MSDYRLDDRGSTPAEAKNVPLGSESRTVLRPTQPPI
jgi:hypothetical protein